MDRKMLPKTYPPSSCCVAASSVLPIVGAAIVLRNRMATKSLAMFFGFILLTPLHWAQYFRHFARDHALSQAAFASFPGHGMWAPTLCFLKWRRWFRRWMSTFLNGVGTFLHGLSVVWRSSRCVFESC